MEYSTFSSPNNSESFWDIHDDRFGIIPRRNYIFAAGKAARNNGRRTRRRFRRLRGGRGTGCRANRQGHQKVRKYLLPNCYFLSVGSYYHVRRMKTISSWLSTSDWNYFIPWIIFSYENYCNFATPTIQAIPNTHHQFISYGCIFSNFAMRRATTRSTNLVNSACQSSSPSLFYHYHFTGVIMWAFTHRIFVILFSSPNCSVPWLIAVSNILPKVSTS